jgi:hypothetical protein
MVRREPEPPVGHIKLAIIGPIEQRAQPVGIRITQRPRPTGIRRRQVDEFVHHLANDRQPRIFGSTGASLRTGLAKGDKRIVKEHDAETRDQSVMRVPPAL